MTGNDIFSNAMSILAITDWQDAAAIFVVVAVAVHLAFRLRQLSSNRSNSACSPGCGSCPSGSNCISNDLPEGEEKAPTLVQIQPTPLSKNTLPQGRDVTLER